MPSRICSLGAHPPCCSRRALALPPRRRPAAAEARVPRRLGRHRRQHRLAVASPASPPTSRRPNCSRSSTSAVELKLNAVVFQVRPMADALYESKLEPWSRVPDRRRCGKAPGLRPARVRGGGSPRPRAGTARLVQPVPRPAPVGEVADRRPTTSSKTPARPREALRQAPLDEPDAPGRAGPLARGHPRRGEAVRRRWHPHRRLLLPVQGEGRGRARSSRSPTTTPGRRTRRPAASWRATTGGATR